MNHKGVSLAIILGIIIFITSIVVVSATLVIKQSIAIEADFKAHESYLNAQSSIEAANQIIIREQNISDTFITELSDYMDITIELYQNDIYLVSAVTTTNRLVKSYLTLTNGADSINLTNDYFNQTGIEDDFEHNPLLEPGIMLSNYLNVFIPETYPELNHNEDFQNYQEIFDYIYDLTQTTSTFKTITPQAFENLNTNTLLENYYITGDLQFNKGGNIIIPDGKILFIDGDVVLSNNSLIEGIVVINGKLDVKTARGDSALTATIYASGNISFDSSLLLGSATRPTFIFSDGKVTFKDNVLSYGFVIADEVTFKNSNVNIDMTGGVYAETINNLDESQINVNYTIDDIDILDLGIVNETVITPDSEIYQGSVYTSPK